MRLHMSSHGVQHRRARLSSCASTDAPRLLLALNHGRCSAKPPTLAPKPSAGPVSKPLWFVYDCGLAAHCCSTPRLQVHAHFKCLRSCQACRVLCHCNNRNPKQLYSVHCSRAGGAAETRCSVRTQAATHIQHAQSTAAGQAPSSAAAACSSSERMCSSVRASAASQRLSHRCLLLGEQGPPSVLR